MVPQYRTEANGERNHALESKKGRSIENIIHHILLLDSIIHEDRLQLPRGYDTVPYRNYDRH